MPRCTWNELPESVRGAIERETGPLHSAEIPTAGRNSDFSATLHSPDSTIFCKGIADGAGKRGSMHRHEANINAFLPVAVAPRLLWRTEADGWLLLGFEHVPGHHADLTPGSPDLPRVAETVSALAIGLARCTADAPLLTEQWARLAAWRRLAKDTSDDLDPWARAHLDQLVDWEARGVECVDGDSLAHTDLHSLNMLVTDGQARIVDWAWSRKANPAIDPAFLVTRLIGAGHTPEAAEAWAEDQPSWRATPPEDKTALAVAIWGIWEYLERNQPLPHRAELTAAARKWARFRLA